MKNNCIYLKNLKQEYEKEKIHDFLTEYFSEFYVQQIKINFSAKKEHYDYPYVFVNFLNNVQAIKALQKIESDKKFIFEHYNI